MAILTTTERLAQLETAITAIETGAQEYYIGSRRLRRADLTTLYAERRRLTHDLAAEAGGNVTVAVFDRR